MKKLFLIGGGLALLIGVRIIVIQLKSRSDLQKSLYYQTTGHGSPSLVFLHGLLGSHSNWDKITADLGEQNQLVTLDLLGFAQSPKPSIDYTIDQHIESISSVLKVAKASEKFYIVGHSMGAFLALDFAEQNPNQVLGLILINPPMKTSPDELLKSIEESSSKVIVAMTSNQLFGRLICHLHELVPSVSYPVIRLLEPDLPAAAAKAAGQHTWNSYHKSMENILMAQDFLSLVTSIPNIPILILSSRDDKYADSKTLTGLAMQNHVEIVSIKGGHQIMLQDPAQINSEIKKFISKGH